MKSQKSIDTHKLVSLDTPVSKSDRKKEFLAEIGERLQKAFDGSEIKTYLHLAALCQEIGFVISSDAVAKYFRGDREAGAFTLAGLCAALKVSSDKILFDRDPKAEADEVLKQFANEALEIIQKQRASENVRTKEFATLFEKSPESVQKAVVELLKSATGKKE